MYPVNVHQFKQVVAMKQEGRPPKDAMDRFRTSFWYYAIKKRSGWSDYRLDIEFGYDETPGDRTGADRRRIFERIRANATSLIDSSKLPFDLITRVENHPNFKGTRSLYDSPFWELVNCEPVTLENTKSLVDKCLSLFGFERKIDHLMLDIRDKYPVCIEQIVTSSEPTLDLLALLGALYREAYLVGAIDVAFILSNHFSELLIPISDDLFSDNINDDDKRPNGFASLAQERVLRWQCTDDEWKTLYEEDPYLLATSLIYKV